MTILHAQVTKYFANVVMSSDNDTERLIHLDLEGDGQAELRFVRVQPEEWVSFSEGSVVVVLASSHYGDVYHLLQTEAPVFFLARAEEDPPFFFTTIGTPAEPPGEGLTDPQA